MTSQEPLNLEPRLQVEPGYLEFGILDPDHLANPQSSYMLRISNTGTGMLAGKLIPQVHWLVVFPPDFKCSAGQTSSHQIQLTTGLPRERNWHNYSFTNLLLVSSNVGTFSVGGAYLASPSKPKARPLPLWVALVGLAALPLILAAIFLSRYLGLPAFVEAKAQPTLNLASLRTQVVLTLQAELKQPTPTSVNFTPPPTLPPSISTGSPRTPPPLASISPGTTLTPSPGKTSTPGKPTQILTFTPWATGQYPNPEQFVRDYFAALNDKKYRQAWSMLSTNFQKSCCDVGGNDPYIVYVNWWDTVKRVNVITAYLQAWNGNPAVINVNLRYLFNNGDVSENVQVFKIISDDVLNVLLVDEVQ